MADFVIVTGLSGAGRSTTGACLEDLGWFVIDNLPPSIIPRVGELVSAPGSGAERVALIMGRTGAVDTDELASAIDQGGLLLIKTHAAGGSVVTEHNLIAGLFGVPMKVSGGVVASFVYYPPGHSAKGRKAGMVVVKSGQIKLDAITPAALEALGQPN